MPSFRVGPLLFWWTILSRCKVFWYLWLQTLWRQNIFGWNIFGPADWKEKRSFRFNVMERSLLLLKNKLEIPQTHKKRPQCSQWLSGPISISYCDTSCHAVSIVIVGASLLCETNHQACNIKEAAVMEEVLRSLTRIKEGTLYHNKVLHLKASCSRNSA